MYAQTNNLIGFETNQSNYKPNCFVGRVFVTVQHILVNANVSKCYVGGHQHCASVVSQRCERITATDSSRITKARAAVRRDEWQQLLFELLGIRHDEGLHSIA